MMGYRAAAWRSSHASSGVELSRSVADRRVPEASWPAIPPGLAAGRDDGGVVGDTGVDDGAACALLR